ncbi:ImmA/IrrE family metallo-endopeptidase [Mycoplasma feriruminatoris]|uniref:ImmA/IrrE family metallo-endopeptidase n=1 Tax=Mycoplasma feriruminatoris TaxID=1179777 RepID=A0ABY8HW64_9MOLU|nr:ImmA/IrrE family metallo-endopeptidase [Mycoplasma feriruminatoris]WFQ93868.1 ImmA/IrrE family metallo-endopeptidase [Mycoplasma feriruminatoris]
MTKTEEILLLTSNIPEQHFENYINDKEILDKTLAIAKIIDNEEHKCDCYLYGLRDCIVENTWKTNMLTLKEISNKYESIIRSFLDQEEIQQDNSLNNDLKNSKTDNSTNNNEYINQAKLKETKTEDDGKDNQNSKENYIQQEEAFFKFTAEEVDDLIDSYIRDPKKIQAFIEFSLQIHNKYSLRNLEMIKKQFEGATILKSFTEWKREQIFIKKGEKGIKIWQPMESDYVELENNIIILKKDWTDEIKEKIKNKEIEVKSKVIGFKMGNTFDISQTNLPKEKYPLNYFTYFISEDDDNLEKNTALFNEIKKCIENKNVQVYMDESLGQVKGLASRFTLNGETRSSILLNEHNSVKQNIETLLHEYAHIKYNHSYKDTSRAECEYQAELTAYLLCKKLKIDTRDYSYDYIKSWVDGSTKEDRKKWLNEVVLKSKQINNELEEHFKLTLEQSQKQEKKGVVKQKIKY